MARGTSRLRPSPLRLLFRASQRADRLFAQAIGEVQLRPRQFAVLQAVAAEEGLSQTDIMAATGLDRASTADHVRRLVATGWLRRRRTRRDTRVYAVRLTPEGRKALASGKNAARAVDADLLRHIEPTQIGPLLEALKRMVDQAVT